MSSVLVLVLFVVLAALAPVFGSDSRDGLDWAPGHFWLRRRPTARPGGRSGGRSGPGSASHPLRRSGSPESTSADPAAVAKCRTAPVAG
jgi:hypothetical protein